MARLTRAEVYALIDAERERQAVKWADVHLWGKGDCSSPGVPPIVKAVVLAEEAGEVAKAVLDLDPENTVRELIQVAAVAVAWLEAYE